MKKYIVLGIGIFFLILISGLANASLSDGLVSYWSFDTDATDDYASNDGTVIGAVHNNTAYKLGGGCYDFSDDNISFANEEKFDFDKEDNFSFCFWADSDSTGDVGVLGKGQVESPTFYVQGSSGYKMKVYLRSGAGDYITTTSPNAIYNEYNYYCFTYNNTESYTGLTAYINATNITGGSDAGTLGSILNNFNLVLGQGSTTANGFDGRIDEFAFWNRTLATSEIVELYNSGAGLAYPFTTANDTLNMSATTPTNKSQFNTNPIRFVGFIVYTPNIVNIIAFCEVLAE